MSDLIERVTQAILHSARNDGNDSPVDYGDAEGLARAAIAALDRPADEGEVERVARVIAAEHGLDPDATSPKAALAGHVIPEWIFFCRMAHDRLAAPSLSKDDGLSRI